MTRRALFLADGPSDLPLAQHLETLCFNEGHDVAITAIDPRFLGAADRTVEGRLRLVLAQQPEVLPDLVFVHRDTEGADPDHRRSEIEQAHRALRLHCPIVPVVPVRMTEAWLLLNELSIRTVAGKPGGRAPLKLPRPADVEGIADPKHLLATALVTASETSGRRRQRFTIDFGLHRALLLERLELDGPITQLSSWQRLVADLRSALATFATEEDV